MQAQKALQDVQQCFTMQGWGEGACLKGSRTKSRYKPAKNGMTMSVRKAKQPTLTNMTSHP